jgi:hypothetical protein
MRIWRCHLRAELRPSLCSKYLPEWQLRTCLSERRLCAVHAIRIRPVYHDGIAGLFADVLRASEHDQNQQLTSSGSRLRLAGSVRWTQSVSLARRRNPDAVTVFRVGIVRNRSNVAILVPVRGLNAFRVLISREEPCLDREICFHP